MTLHSVSARTLRRNRSKLAGNLRTQRLQFLHLERFSTMTVAAGAHDNPKTSQKIDEVRAIAEYYLATSTHSSHEIQLVAHELAQLRSLLSVASVLVESIELRSEA